MALIKVYSRDIIGHLFTVIDGGREVKVDIKGINAWALNTSKLNADVPYCTEVDEHIFAKIIDKYKAHHKLFGGKDASGKVHDAKIYVAKTENEARTKMENSEPLAKDPKALMATKTKGLELVKEVN